MKSFTNILLSLSLSVLAAGTSRGDFITFNEFAQGTIIDDEYRSVGLVFAPSGPNPIQIVDITGDAAGGSPSFPFSGPNGARIIDPPAWDDRIVITFVDPIDQTTPAYVTTASFSFFSDAVGLGGIRAFDANDNEIDSSNSVLGGVVGGGVQGYETLSVAGADIRRVEISGFNDVIVDVFTYSTPVSVPEPSAFSGLLAFGLCAVLGVRSRRT